MIATYCVAAALIRYFCALLLLGSFSFSFAASVVDPTTYLSAIANAEPGSVIKLTPGIYYDGLPIVGLRGASTQPIVIEAANPARPPRLLARPRKNTVSIVNSSHVQIRNLVLDGRGLPVDAVKAEGHSRFAHHITLEGLRIINHGADQGNIGISTKCPAWGWIIRRNVIIRAGTGMYLGNSDGSAPFFDGVIEHNLIFDTLGYNLQIKHQHVRSPEADWTPGPHTTIIRHNVFSKYGNAAQGQAARPNVLVGHFPKEAHGVNDRYVVYGNFFYANSTEALFQGEGNIALYANLFVNPFGDAIHVQPHNDVPKNIWLFHNTVIASNVGIHLRGDTENYLRALAGNVVFAASPEAPRLEADNLIGEYAQANAYLNKPFASPGRLNLKIKSDIAVAKPATCAFFELFPDAGRDFEGIPYKACGVGAYERGSRPPRWNPNLAFKPNVQR
ncbi:MAG TPA: hypothetical protein VM532_18015 [Burkholderiales bacterium]|nr:hypothetical protein [Burkholderiales bacterium]